MAKGGEEESMSGGDALRRLLESKCSRDGGTGSHRNSAPHHLWNIVRVYFNLLSTILMVSLMIWY